MCLVSHASGEMVEMIARQHIEFSGFAQRMAAQWRKGELQGVGVSEKRAARGGCAALREL